MLENVDRSLVVLARSKLVLLKTKTIVPKMGFD